MILIIINKCNYIEMLSPDLTKNLQSPLSTGISLEDLTADFPHPT